MLYKFKQLIKNCRFVDQCCALEHVNRVAREGIVLVLACFDFAGYTSNVKFAKIILTASAISLSRIMSVF